MSLELGCSKSSFYWYFKNRNEFITRLVERWFEFATKQIITKSSEHEQAEAQLTEMLKSMFAGTQKGDFLFYLRKLSIEDTSFHTMLETIEQTRMSYAKTIFIKAGMEPEAAEQKSHILYHYYLGWYERFKLHQVDEKQLKQHIEMLRTNLLAI